MKPRRMPKACRALLVEFSKYLDGEQPPAACRRIERHLASCASCAAATEQIRNVVASCHELKEQSLPEAVRRRARQRIKALLDT